MKQLRELIGACNVYLAETASPNARLLENVALYCTKILQVFGAIPTGSKLGYPVDSEEMDMEGAVTPFASLMAEFREEVRQISLKDKCGLMQCSS